MPGFAGKEGLVWVEGRVDLGRKGCVLADSGHDGSYDDGGLHDEAAGAIGGNHDPFGAFEEFADADSAAIVDV